MQKNSEAQTILKKTIDSPLGTIRLLATREGLVGVRLPSQRAGEDGSATKAARASNGAPGDGDDPSGMAEAREMLERAAGELREYFAGRLQAFSTPIAMSGTPFQEAVWRGLLTIPFGERRSYGWLAERIGRPGASRAVGAANGCNPVGIVVPCHRVIGADGSLTGYGGGLEAKRWLLEHERAVLEG